MDSQIFLNTERLLIEPLALTDNDFIFELLNTEGWLKFIGNRHITSPAEASTYIQKIIYNPNATYWVAKLKVHQTPIGIITFIKRDYLEHHDIGFAFLPGFANKGYAHEAASAVLNSLIHSYKLSHIFATTFPENTTSIKLLKKLGLAFDKEIEIDKEKLHVYAVSADKLY
jgi:ribosomal-protein-alanine N-acetyltransferase